MVLTPSSSAQDPITNIIAISQQVLQMPRPVPEEVIEEAFGRMNQELARLPYLTLRFYSTEGSNYDQFSRNIQILRHTAEDVGVEFPEELTFPSLIATVQSKVLSKIIEAYEKALIELEIPLERPEGMIDEEYLSLIKGSLGERTSKDPEIQRWIDQEKEASFLNMPAEIKERWGQTIAFRGVNSEMRAYSEQYMAGEIKKIATTPFLQQRVKDLEDRSNIQIFMILANNILDTAKSLSIEIPELPTDVDERIAACIQLLPTLQKEIDLQEPLIIDSYHFFLDSLNRPERQIYAEKFKAANDNISRVKIIDEIVDLLAPRTEELEIVSDIIPPQIERLTELGSLTIRGGELEVLPPQLFRLRNLHTLNLGGHHISEVPAEIGQLTSLRILRLNNNQIRNMPSLKSLTKLDTLDLSFNQLESLPEGLKSLKKVVLDVSGNPNLIITSEIRSQLRKNHRT